MMGVCSSTNSAGLAPYLEHVPADVTAGIFWLKNRDPENWRDVQNVDHVLGKYIISDRPMTEEEGGTRTSDDHRREGARGAARDPTETEESVTTSVTSKLIRNAEAPMYQGFLEFRHVFERLN
jgi:hypothetical protein